MTLWPIKKPLFIRNFICDDKQTNRQTEKQNQEPICRELIATRAEWQKLKMKGGMGEKKRAGVLKM